MSDALQKMSKTCICTFKCDLRLKIQVVAKGYSMLMSCPKHQASAKLRSIKEERLVAHEDVTSYMLL